MTDTVRLTTGGVPQRMNFALPGVTQSLSTTVVAKSAPVLKDGLHATYQATVRGTAGAQTATVLIYGTNVPHAAGADDQEAGTRNTFPINMTNGSPTITCVDPGGLFRSDMDGDEVYAAGVPLGTTMTYVSGNSATLSANATATSGPTGTPGRFQSLEWVLLGTITLSGTKLATDGFATMAAWKWTSASVTALTGTGAAVSVRQGV